MQKVTFISDLKVSSVRKMSGSEYFNYHKYDYDMKSLVPIKGTDQVLDVEGLMVKTVAVPIIQLCGVGKEDLYIAYSEEVKDLLGIPIQAIVDQNNSLGKSLSIEREKRYLIKKKINNLGLWKRLRYFVTGRMEESSWS